jgi:hypothetical protein
MSEQEKFIRELVAGWLRDANCTGTATDVLVAGCTPGVTVTAILTGLLRDCEVVRAAYVGQGTVDPPDLWPPTYDGDAGTALFIRDKAKVPVVDVEKAKVEIRKLREDVILRKLCVEARIVAALEALGEPPDALKGGGK